MTLLYILVAINILWSIVNTMVIARRESIFTLQNEFNQGIYNFETMQLEINNITSKQFEVQRQINMNLDKKLTTLEEKILNGNISSEQQEQAG